MSDSPTVAEPILPAVAMNLVTPKNPVIGRVVDSRLCMKGKSASFVRHVQIDVGGTPLEGSFRVGQSFGVVPPGNDEQGKPHQVRLYSIACPSWGEDGQGRVVSTTPKRLIDERTPQAHGDDADDHRLFLGICSNYLCDVRAGDEVMVTGPSGKRFLLPTEPDLHDYLFLATGTGIAPFRGMAMELLDGPRGPMSSQVHLVMGAPYTTDLLYDDLFTRLQNEHSNFHYHTAISRERRPDGSRGRYVHQLLDDEWDAFAPLLSNPRTLIYICGLIGMQLGIFQLLARRGLIDQYAVVKEPLTQQPADQWESDQIKRYVRAAARCMVEVY